ALSILGGSILTTGPLRVRSSLAVSRYVGRDLTVRPLLAGNRDRERGRRPGDLASLELQNAQQIRLRTWARIVAGEHVSSRSFGLRLQDRPLALQIEVLQEQVLVVGEVVERDEEARLLVVVVVPLRPSRLGQRRILLVPGACRLVGRQRSLEGVGAAVAERL